MNILVVDMLLIAFLIRRCNNLLFRINTLDPVGTSGQHFRFYIQYHSSLIKDPRLDNFYIQLFFHGSNKTEFHCVSTMRDEEKEHTFKFAGKILKKAPKSFSRVRLFQLEILTPGKYTVYARKTVGLPGRSQTLLGGVVSAVGIEVFSKLDSCLESATFKLRGREITFNPRRPLSVRYDRDFVAKRLLKSPNCLLPDARKIKHNWILERINQDYPKIYSIPSSCWNYKRIAQVDVDRMIKHLVYIELPVPMTTETLLLQPPLLSPNAYYYFCANFSDSYETKKVCRSIATDGYDVVEFIRLKVRPLDEHIVWNQGDLTVDASETIFLYELPEAGYIIKKTMRFVWKCTGNDRLCELISANQLPHNKLKQGSNADTTLINTKAPYVTILDDWVIGPATITIHLTVYVTKNERNYKSTKRVIEFIKRTPRAARAPEVYIRCIINCGNFVIPEVAMVLGMGCDGCEDLPANGVVVNWTSVDLEKVGATFVNETEMYVIIEGIKPVKSSTFSVLLTFKYTEPNGEEILAFDTAKFHILHSSYHTSHHSTDATVTDTFGVDEKLPSVQLDLPCYEFSKTRLLSPVIRSVVLNITGGRDVTILRSVSSVTDFNIQPFSPPHTFSVHVTTSVGGFLETVQYRLKGFPQYELKNLDKTFWQLQNKVTYDLTYLGPITYFLLQPSSTDEKSKLVVSILSFLRREQQTLLSYSNIDLILQVLDRMLNVGKNTLEKMHLILNIFDRLIYIHRAVKNALLDVETLFRRELEMLDSLKVEFIAGIKNKEYFQTDFQAFLLADGLICSLLEILQHTAEKYIQEQGKQSHIELREAVVSMICLNMRDHHERVLGKSYSYMYISSRSYISLFHQLSVDNYLDMAIYASKTSPLKQSYRDFNISLPLLVLSVQQKMPLQYMLAGIVSNIYDLRFQMSRIQNQDNHYTLNLYGPDNGDGVFTESDCLMIKVDMSVSFATLLTFTMEPGIKLEVTARPLKYLRETLDFFSLEPQTVPMKNHETYRKLRKDKNRLFLPQLTSQQEYDRRGGFYHIMIKVSTEKDNKTNKPTIDKTVRSSGVVKFKVGCAKIACVKWESRNQSWSTKYCRPTAYSAGSPSVLNCQCDTGHTFSGGLAPCRDVHNIPWNYYDILDVRMVDPNTLYLHMFSVVLALWMVFLFTLAWTQKRDAAESHLGNTFVLPRLFSPYEREQYLVCVCTGWMYGAGTMSTPWMTLVDRFFHVTFPLFTHIWMFPAGSEVWFLMSCPKGLVKIKQILLSFAPEHIIDNWQISHIFLRNLRTKQDSYAIFDCWIPSRAKRINFAVTNVTLNAGLARNLILIFVRSFRSLHCFFGVIFNIQGSSFNKSLHALCCLATAIIVLFCCLLVTGGWTISLRGDTRAVTVPPMSRNFIYHLAIVVLISSVISFALILWFDVISSLNQPHKLVWVHSKSSGETEPAQDEPIATDANANRDSVTPDQPDADDSRYGPMPGDFLSDWISQARRSSAYRAKRGSTSADAKLFDVRRLTMESGVDPSKAQQDMLTSRLLSVFLENVGVDVQDQGNYDVHQNRKVWPALLFLVTVLLVLIALIVLSALLSHAGLNLPTSGRVLLLSLLAFLIIVLITHPIFILLLSAAKSQINLPNKVEADKRMKEWRQDMYMNLRLACEPTTHTSRQIPRVYLSTTAGRIGRKYCDILIERYHHLTSLRLLSDPGTKLVKRRSVFMFIFVVVVIINVQSGSVWTRYTQTKYVRQLLQVGRIDVDLKQGITIEEFWEHLRQYIHLKTYWSRANTNTTSSFISLSNARLRQLRVRPYQGNCTEDFPMLLTPHCHFDIADSQLETDEYALSWKRKLTHPSPRRLPFTFQKQGFIYQTEQMSYPSGGYDAFFSLVGREPKKIDYLKSRKWVDDRTRAVRLDLALYNADTQLVTSVVHVYEFTSKGIFQNTHQVYSFPLFYTGTTHDMLKVFMLAMALFTFYFACIESLMIYRQGIRHYMESYLSWLNLVERVTCIIVIFMFILEYVIRHNAVDTVHKIYFESLETTEYVDFSSVSGVSFTMTLLSCLLATLVFLKVLIQTSSIPSLNQFLQLIPPVSRLIYLLALTVWCYAMLGHFLFGDVHEFYTFRNALFTVIELIINGTIIRSLITTYWLLAPIYIFVTMSFMNYIIVNYFITLLNEEYSRICQDMRSKGQGQKYFIYDDYKRLVEKYWVKDKNKKEEKRKRKELERIKAEQEKKAQREYEELSMKLTSHKEFQLFDWSSQTMPLPHTGGT